MAYIRVSGSFRALKTYRVNSVTNDSDLEFAYGRAFPQYVARRQILDSREDMFLR